MSQKSLFSILEVRENASQSEIKKAYRKLALKHHPDKNPNGKEKFQEIQNAYSILTDPEKRKKFDMGQSSSSQWSSNRAWSSDDDDDSDESDDDYGEGFGFAFSFLFSRFWRRNYSHYGDWGYGDCGCFSCSARDYGDDDEDNTDDSDDESNYSWKKDYGESDEDKKDYGESEEDGEEQSEIEEDEDDPLESEVDEDYQSEGEGEEEDQSKSYKPYDFEPKKKPEKGGTKKNKRKSEADAEKRELPERPPKKQKRKCGDVKFNIYLTKAELAKGKKKVNVTYDRSEPCPTCSGTGMEGVRKKPEVPCSVCDASGYVYNRDSRTYHECPKCEGYGSHQPVLKLDKKCKDCNGIKVTSMRCSRNIDVSPGMEFEDCFVFLGQGHRAAYHENGDLLVYLQEKATVKEEPKPQPSSTTEPRRSSRKREAKDDKENLPKKRTRAAPAPRRKSKK